jgi:bleomycin hydrolase
VLFKHIFTVFIMPIKCVFYIIIGFFTALLNAQETLENFPGSAYHFTITHHIPSLPVQDQGQTGTCWSFAGISFAESEIIRISGAPTPKLSEMFLVRSVYLQKTERYIRMHARANFGEGGEPHNLLNSWNTNGIVPLEVYDGKVHTGIAQQSKYNYCHRGLDSQCVQLLQPIAQHTGTILTPYYTLATEAILQKYMGAPPERFDYNGKSYNAKSFAKTLPFIPEDYICFTSFSHHPYYTAFPLEIPDNWDHQQYYNVPLDVFESIILRALEKGFSIAWAADVSEPYFKFDKALAIVPENWTTLSSNQQMQCFLTPCKEQAITAAIRQQAFDTFETQDDHAMHIIGLAQDQRNKPFVLVKNSWGTRDNPCSGLFFASLNYIRYKSISIMLHKSAVSEDIRAIFGIK